MVSKKLVVFAIYSASSNVEHAIKSLINANINAADISVWFSQSLTSRELDSYSACRLETKPTISSR